MGKEQRRFQRLVRPFEATFRGASGASPCRIGDISWGGCFVQAMAQPKTGDPTEIAFLVGETMLTLQGRVVYVEPGMGFAVQFDPLTPEHVEVLRDVLSDPNL